MSFYGFFMEPERFQNSWDLLYNCSDAIASSLYSSFSPFLFQCLARNTRFVLAWDFIKEKQPPGHHKFRKIANIQTAGIERQAETRYVLRNFYETIKIEVFFLHRILRVFRSCWILLKLSSDCYKTTQTRSLCLNK